MVARTSSNLTCASKSSAGRTLRSTLIAPIALPSNLIGTQKKAIFWPLERLRSPVFARKRGSLLISGTTTSLPVCTTRPVTPSPTRYVTCFLDSSLSPCATLIVIISLSESSSAIEPRSSLTCVSSAFKISSSVSFKSSDSANALATSASKPTSFANFLAISNFLKQYNKNVTIGYSNKIVTQLQASTFMYFLFFSRIYLPFRL